MGLKDVIAEATSSLSLLEKKVDVCIGNNRVQRERVFSKKISFCPELNFVLS
jgi:hypothetical protein